MSELVDVACDICGQKYRWSPDRIGVKMGCRECGTKFEAVRYVPPPDEDSASGSPLPWIKGACVAALVIAAVAGLGSLPFVRPAPAVAVADNNRPQKADKFGNAPAPARPIPQQPAGLPPDVQERLNALREKAKVPEMGGPGLPQPGLPPGVPGLRNPVPMPRVPDLPRRRGRGVAAPGQGPASDPASGTARPAGPQPEVTGEAPVITEWSLSGERSRKELRLKGRGLKYVTKVEKLLVLNLFNMAYTTVSENELVVQLPSVPGDDSMLFAVTTPDGVAVAFANDVKTVNAEETIQPAIGPPQPCFIRKGGAATFRAPVVVLVEDGGRANVSGITGVAFLKKGAELSSAIVNTLIAEEGAQVKHQHPVQRNEAGARALTFCPLPRPAEAR